MATITETDIKELKDLINARFDKQSEEIRSLQIDVTEVKAKLSIIEPSIQKIPDLAEKVGELKNWRQLVFIVVTALFSGLMGWILRGGKI